MPFQYFQIIYTPLGNLYHKFKGKLSNPRDCKELPRDPPPNCWHCCCLYPHCRSCKKSVLKAANPDFRGVIFFPRHADFTCNIYNIYIICIHIYIYTLYLHIIYIHYIYIYTFLAFGHTIHFGATHTHHNPIKAKAFCSKSGRLIESSGRQDLKKDSGGWPGHIPLLFFGSQLK